MRDGCVLYNDYHQNIEKTYFNRPNFPFPSLSSNTLVERDGTIWSCCCPNGHIPSDDYGIPTCSLNDFTRSAEHWAYPRSKSLKTDANSCTKQRECLLFKVTWGQISSRDARFIFSLHAGAVVWPLLPDRDTFCRCFDLGFHDQMAASKLSTSQKGHTLIRACQITSWNLCTSISKP